MKKQTVLKRVGLWKNGFLTAPLAALLSASIAALTLSGEDVGMTSSEPFFANSSEAVSETISEAVSEANSETDSETVSASWTIDADFPGGNIIVDSVQGETVHLRQDLRDTEGSWFHWAFRVRGAQGKRLSFEFAEWMIGARGPAVSRDGGLSWKWLSGEGADYKRFEYHFGPDEESVLFAFAMIYAQADLERFLSANQDRFSFRKSVLCRSRKGRDVERIQFGNPDNEHHLGVVLLCRHHAGESVAAYVIEGIVEEVFSGSAQGAWLLANVDFFWVPFMDKDGVEEGDQGKNRRPHDHNRDYFQKIYPEVRAVTEQIPEWSRGKRIMVCDFHCPWNRGGINETVYFPGDESPLMSAQLTRFCVLLQNRQPNDGLPYREYFNLPFGREWNVGTGDPNLMMSTQWAATLPNTIFTAGLEIPFANASGVEVTAESARDFGHRYALALYDFLREEVEHPTIRSADP